MRQKSAIPSTPLTDFVGKVGRTISINFTNAGTDAAPDYAVEVVTTYKVLDTAKSSLGFTGTHADDASTTFIERSGNLSKAESNIMPRSIYLYFEGLSGASSTNREKIEINNTTNQPVTVYLIRNVDPATLTQPSVITFNNNYACDVYVSSKESTDPSALIVDNVEIVSNLRSNLLYDDNKRVYKEGTMEKLDGITDAEVASTHYSRARSLIYYNDDSTAIGDSVSKGNDFYEKYVFDGYRRTQKDVLYDVKIEIRENGKTRTIASYTGGLSN